jgi:GNAT superfamily N-acetyltransferase
VRSAPFALRARRFAVIVVAGDDVVLRRARLDEILVLRQRELRPGLPPEEAAFDGDDDVQTQHFGAFAAGARDNLACATLMARAWQGEPAWQLRGMATRADVARRGIGGALLRYVEGAVCDAGGPQLLWCNARVVALPFYERFGWTAVSDVFEIAGVGPHRAMVRRLATCGTAGKR